MRHQVAEAKAPGRVQALFAVEMKSSPLLREALPEFADELVKCLIAAGEVKLARQVPHLRIVDRCRCGEHFCATVNIVHPRAREESHNHRNVLLNTNGMVILDVDGQQVTCIEVLYRNDVRIPLLALLP